MLLSENMVKEFEKYLFNEEKSENTLSKYIRDVKAFIRWAGEGETDKETVLRYKKTLIDNYAPQSVNSILSSLNTFFTFIGRYELKVKTVKIQRKIFADSEKELSKKEYERLLSAAKNKKNSRLYYLMQTIGSTGIRISELKYVTVENVKKGKIQINSKGKMRVVFLPEQLCKILHKYAKSKKITSGALFVTKNGKPLDRSCIWKMMKNLCADAGVAKSKVFPHNLRHLFARTYYSVQKDIVRLADILGHSSVNTTRIYTMESGEIHRKQIQLLGLLRC